MIPKGFFPQQDNGIILGTAEAGQDISYTDMVERVHGMARIVSQDPDVATVWYWVGANPTVNTGRISVELKPFGERKATSTQVVARLRRAFPEFVFIMQNATSAATREAVVDGVPFPRLLDGVSREEVYTPRYDRDAEAELLAWKNLGPAAGGAPLSITTLDYLGNCSDRRRALRVYTRSRSNGFSPYVTISSADQNTVCHWRL